MTTLLQARNVQMNLNAPDQAAVIFELVSRETTQAVTTPETVVAAVLAREAEVPTGFVQGIAIPHAKTAGVTHPAVMIGRLNMPVAWSTLDGSAVDTVILILTPDTVAEAHLKILAMIAERLADEETITALKQASTPEAIIHILQEDE